MLDVPSFWCENLYLLSLPGLFGLLIALIDLLVPRTRTALAQHYACASIGLSKWNDLP